MILPQLSSDAAVPAAATTCLMDAASGRRPVNRVYVTPGIKKTRKDI